MTPLVEVEDLEVHFPVRKGVVLRRQIGAVRAVAYASARRLAIRSLSCARTCGCGRVT